MKPSIFEAVWSLLIRNRTNPRSEPPISTSVGLFKRGTRPPVRQSKSRRTTHVASINWFCGLVFLSCWEGDEMGMKGDRLIVAIDFCFWCLTKGESQVMPVWAGWVLDESGPLFLSFTLQQRMGKPRVISQVNGPRRAYARKMRIVFFVWNTMVCGLC